MTPISEGGVRNDVGDACAKRHGPHRRHTPESVSGTRVLRVSTTGTYRRVTTPLTSEALEPLPTVSEGIQFSEPLLADEYRQISELLDHHPDKRLLALQLDSTRSDHITELGFLRFFPNLRNFSCSLELLRTLDGVENLQSAVDLRVFKTQRRLSAAPLGALSTLERLWLDGPFSDRAVLRELTGVTDFNMGYAAKVSDLSFLPPNSARFSMNQGSVTDISALADLPHLRRLSFHKVHGVADLTPLAGAPKLQFLYLAHLNKVTQLFDMSALTELTELTISSMTKLTELRPVLTAPSLTKLTVYDLPALVPGSWHDTCVGWLAQGKPPFWE